METFRCEICQKSYPISLMDEHHRIPKALGGPDTPANIAKLYKGCHQNLHTVAYILINPKRKAELDATLFSIFPTDEGARRRLLGFAVQVAKEMSLKKETKKKASDLQRTVIEFPGAFMELIHLSGYDMAHKGGKKAGVSWVVRQAVAEFLIRKFPMKKDLILTELHRKKEKS